MLRLRSSSFFADNLLKNLIRNAGVLLTGNVGASLLGVVSSALTARALGPELFSILVLVTTYALVADRLLNFQSWQAIIKYGADILGSDNREDFSTLVRFGFLLDGSTAILGAVVASLVAWFFGHWRGWDADVVFMASAFSATIIFHVSGAPTAILRLLNRFDLISVHLIVTSAVKTIGVIIVFFVGGGLPAFLTIWALAEISGRSLLVVFALRVFRFAGYRNSREKTIDSYAVQFPGIWSFVFTTNLHSSIRMASREIDVFVIGALLSPSSVGFFKVAKQVSHLLTRMSDPLYQSIYPELARLRVTGQNRRLISFATKAALIAGLIAIVIWIGVVFFGEAILGVVFGIEYAAAHPILVWYMLATVVSVCGFPLQPMMLSFGLPQRSFRNQVGATIAYFGLLFPLTTYLQTTGAALAYLGYYILWTIITFLSLARVMRR